MTADGDHTYTYAHDAVGALEEVRRDGVLTEAYAYDLDGDRTQRTLAASAPEAATYDAGGKLDSRGGVELHVRRRRLPRHARRATPSPTTAAATCARRPSAARRSRTPTTRSAAGSRASRARSSRQLRLRRPRLRRGGCPPRARRTARSTATSTARAATSTRSCAGARRFYVGTDQVGSPRVVVDASGAVVKRLEYDAYGVETDLDRASSCRSATRAGCATR